MTRECSEEDTVDQLTLAFKTLSGDKVNKIHQQQKIAFLFLLVLYYSRNSETRITTCSS
jgi:hypothetical protein